MKILNSEKYIKNVKIKQEEEYKDVESRAQNSRFKNEYRKVWILKIVSGSHFAVLKMGKEALGELQLANNVSIFESVF